LKQRENPVEPVVKEKPIETEVFENEGFIVDFEGTIENAKNIARYAKEVVGAKGVTFLVCFTHFFTVDSFLLLFLSLKQPYSFLLFSFFGYLFFSF
jgi:hypothetical protein